MAASTGTGALAALARGAWAMMSASTMAAQKARSIRKQLRIAHSFAPPEGSYGEGRRAGRVKPRSL
jgi:hypothetical protein